MRLIRQRPGCHSRERGERRCHGRKNDVMDRVVVNSVPYRSLAIKIGGFKVDNTVSRRRFLTTSAAVAVGVALSACGATPTAPPVPATPTKAGAAPTAAPAAPTAVPTRATVELVVVKSEHPLQPIVQDAPAHLEVTKLTGVKMNFQPIPAADWPTKEKLWMSTKQVPDLMYAAFAQRFPADPAAGRQVCAESEEVLRFVS